MDERMKTLHKALLSINQEITIHKYLFYFKNLLRRVKGIKFLFKKTVDVKQDVLDNYNFSYL